MSTRYFYGDAEDIADEWTLTPASVGIGNTFTARINGKDITVTATAATVANVTALLAAAINDNVNEIEEFTEVVAVDNETLVTVTAREKGVPIGLSSTAAGGTATLTAVNTVVATGSKFWDNADNYSGDAVPVDTDDVVHVKGDILYGLSQTGLALASFTKKKGSGRIGLPEWHQVGAGGYDEYRTTYLTLESCTTITIEDDAPRVKINCGTTAASSPTIRSTGVREDPDVPVVLIQGGHASAVMNIQRGDVGVAFYEGETANFPTFNVGYVDNVLGDSTVFIGDGTSTITTYKQSGGRVESEAAITTATVQDGEFLRRAGAVGTINMDGGVGKDASNAAISTMLRVSSGGTWNAGHDLRAVTYAAVELYAGFTFLDPNARVTSTAGYDFVRCKVTDGVLDLGENRNLAVTAA